MKEPTDLGPNRTGRDASPFQFRRMRGEEMPKVPEGGVEDLRRMRGDAIASAEPVGTVPIPASFKGVFKSVLEKLKGKNPAVLIDKLSERLAFERTGVRLYQMMIDKCQYWSAGAEGISISDLERIMEQEHAHMEMLFECIESMGADPTSMTPSADVTGVAASGIVKVLQDARTSPLECLHALTLAELGDTAGWEGLVDIARELGLKEFVERFDKALAEEREHVRIIEDMYSRGVMNKLGA